MLGTTLPWTLPGHAEAQFRGRGVAQSDEKAFERFQKEPDQDSAVAQCNLATGMSRELRRATKHSSCTRRLPIKVM
jgi:hypothetical protein